MAGFFSTLPGGAPQFSGGLINAYVKNNSAAVFADINLSLTDQIKVFGGLRYTHETMDLYHHRNEYLAPYSIYDPMTGAVSAAPTSTVVIADDRTIDNLSGRAGMQYQPANNLNLYASFLRGRSVERRVGKEGVRTCGSRWVP